MTTNEQDREASRIIVDEDWKARVQAEKEAVAAAQQTQPGRPAEPAGQGEPADAATEAAPSSDAPAPDAPAPDAAAESAATESVPPARPQPAGDSSKADRQQPLNVPPASFSVLVSTLAAQAMAALESSLSGPNDSQTAQQQAVQPALARHFIDTLGILESKTQGNLTDEEKLLLSNVLHELRMLFVTVQSKSG